MKKIDLCGEWLGKCLPKDSEQFEYTGVVPGCAIADLVRAQRLPSDLFWEKNADSVTEYENCDYVYSREFCFEGECGRATLVFERVDTYADIYLNGEKTHHNENGNIRVEIPVEKYLKRGKNTLEVRFYSPVLWVEGRPEKEGAFTIERMHTRRMQCTYGWDWVARFVTVGLGEAYVCLYESDELSTDNVYIATLDADSECACVRVDVGFEGDYRGRVLDFVILSPEGDIAARIQRYCQEPLIRTDFDVVLPRLWYPLGYGEQPIYTFLLKDGEKVIYSESFGIRTARILQMPDEVGSRSYKKCLSIKGKYFDFNESFSSFTLKINGKKIYCKGANWVPCEPYAIGDVSKKQTEILELCAEAGVNMIRVWGGGAFETRHFYNECSRLGICVTQDFLMACGSYPEDEEWFIDELKKEAHYAARLIRNQPCLVWWSGDNENAVQGCDTDEDYLGRRSAYEGIAPVLYKEDPYRRFLPSSPYGGNKYASNTVGTTHNTNYIGDMFEYFLGDVSNYKDDFKAYRARFIAEEPQFGASSITSLMRFMSEENIYEGEDSWLYHTKNNPSLERELFEYCSRFTEGVLGKYKDGRDRLFKLRYIQYEWIRVVMEQARREKDICSGIIFWMLNDCWPAAAGWSLIDYYNLPKDAYYSFKRCAKPVIASIDRVDGVFKLCIINDSGKAQRVTCKLSLLCDDKKTVRELDSFELTVGEYAEREIECALGDGELLILDLVGDGINDRAFYKNGALSIIPAEVEYRLFEGENKITVFANSYVHCVMLSGNAVFEDSCFSLLPGESRTVSYRPLGSDASVSCEGYTVS